MTSPIADTSFEFTRLESELVMARVRFLEASAALTQFVTFFAPQILT